MARAPAGATRVLRASYVPDGAGVGPRTVLVRGGGCWIFELHIAKIGAAVADEEHIRRLQQGAEAWNTWRRDILRRGDLSHADLRGANLNEADLHEAYLRGADLGDAYLRSANLRGANLREANLSGAFLSRANLGDVNLSGANLSETTLTGANLCDANLSGASLIYADLWRANLKGANLTMAKLGETAFAGVTLTGVLRNLYTSRAEHDRPSNASKIRPTAHSVSSGGRLAGQID
jgi:uncharacterized protein YjbI with pentapeptide repeats